MITQESEVLRELKNKFDDYATPRRHNQGGLVFNFNAYGYGKFALFWGKLINVNPARAYNKEKAKTNFINSVAQELGIMQ